MKTISMMGRSHEVTTVRSSRAVLSAAMAGCLLAALVASCSDDPANRTTTTPRDGSPGTVRDGSPGAVLDGPGGDGRMDLAVADDAVALDGAAGADGGNPDPLDAADDRIFDRDDGGFPPGATVGSCSSLNWNVSASSSGPNDPPLNAIDGAPSSRWSAGAPQIPGQYFEVDFGGYVQLSQITLNTADSAGDYPRGYEVGVSTDSVDFSRIIAAATVDVQPANGTVTIDFPLHSARYVRIFQTGSSGSWWSIHELSMDCRAPGAPVDPLLCRADGGVGDAGMDGGNPDARDAGGTGPFVRANWRAMVTPVSDGGAGIPPSNAFDGDITTRWSTGAPQVGNESFKLDLGTVGCIGQVWLTTAGNEVPRVYRLEVSVDDVTYTTVARGNGQNIMQLVFPSRSARYIRVLQTGVTAVAPWSINEIAVTP
jgi:hypothetical protein